jgi:AcrR family transcriptional regulator
MNKSAAKKARHYRMGERAVSTEATRQRIIDVAIKLLLERWYDEISLREIAATAGVALQTVINHFGTKDGIFTAAFDEPIEVNLMRTAAAPDDIEGAVRLLVDEYERVGDGVIRMLALEGRVPALRPTADRGRKEHREWVHRTFPAALAPLEGAARERRLNLLVCATDVYTWKLLRRDRELGKGQVATAIRELLEALHR